MYWLRNIVIGCGRSKARTSVYSAENELHRNTIDLTNTTYTKPNNNGVNVAQVYALPSAGDDCKNRIWKFTSPLPAQIVLQKRR